MIRTRDLVLFIVVVLFLLVGIISTVTLRPPLELPDTVALVDPSEVTGGLAEADAIDRQANIARIREQLADSEAVLTPQPSVTAGTETEALETSTGVATLLERCSAPDDALSIVPKWPIGSVNVAIDGLTRSAYIEETIVVTDTEVVGTTTVPIETTEIIRTPLLTMPVLPTKASSPRCVPSEVIGITNRGVLMFNGDMRAYRGISSETQIGYARDGFPIYGLYDGEVDACGGYDHSTGYRYTVSAQRDYIIGCYVGAPAVFTLE